MAPRSVCLSAYVAFLFLFAFIASNKFSSANPAVGGSRTQSLLPPYDFLYYSGVRAYFGGEWTKAAELLEKSIVTKESLITVRKKCHEECTAAGREALDKLGKLEHRGGERVRGLGGPVPAKLRWCACSGRSFSLKISAGLPMEVTRGLACCFSRREAFCNEEP